MIIISNTNETINSLDVIDRIEELKAEISSIDETFLKKLIELKRDENKLNNQKLSKEDVDALLENYGEEIYELNTELKELTDFENNVKQYPSNWDNGTTLVHKEYFAEYCKDLVKDAAGKIPSYVEIDWNKTADNILCDYNEVEFGYETYLIKKEINLDKNRIEPKINSENMSEEENDEEWQELLKRLGSEADVDFEKFVNNFVKKN